ncbi:MAG: S8 family peptidase [Flavobacteriales bacterium]
MRNIVVLILSVAIGLSLQAQDPNAPMNWHLKDAQTNNLQGTSTEKAYKELLQNGNQKEIVVAILDSGVDIYHEDLQGKIWVNEDEIPANGIDDDKNGYIDDVNGWSFIGGEGGDVNYDNLEFTRIYKKLKAKYEGKSADNISKSDKKDYAKYLRFEEQYKKRMEDAEAEYNEFMQIYMAYQQAKALMQEKTRKEDPTLEELAKVKTENEMEEAFKAFVMEIKSAGAESQLEEGKEHYESAIKYMYNLDFDSRGIVGDNYEDVTEKYYGNNNVKGPDSRHGTHVAGIVAAVRNNKLGAQGIAHNVKIMSVRVVPNGDERDKDVANSIRYAVDNGAHIINMSFGKSYSPNKGVVDEAARYAASKGVLLVHAAGNSSKNIDQKNNFPNDTPREGGKQISSWIEVGSSSWMEEPMSVSSFSNYGKKSIDIFSPGSDIYSTTPENNYERLSGTSMAAPVVAGVAALVWSNNPELSAVELKEILIDSAVNKKKIKVDLPGESTDLVKFKKLGKNGGIVNTYNALKLASEKAK